MNFEFSEEQDLLREQARGFLEQACPPSLVRAVLNGEKTGDSDLAKKIADMGWTATVIPEEHGGLGLSYYELCVIAEEMGRAVVPTSFSSSVYLATEALLIAGSEAQKAEWLPKLAAGDAIGTFALAEGPGRAAPGNLKTTLTGGKINGTKVPVADAAVANIAVVVVASGKGDGASLALVDLSGGGVDQSPVKMIDPTRTHSSVTFNGASAQLLGAEGQGWALTQRLYDRAAVLFAWEQVGGANAALEQAREYAMGRYAFGRPIASYQAIKHKLANMYVKNTLARSNCYYGAWALDTNAADLPLAAATARVGAIHAYEFASREDIQTHGGMGFTWEFDCQFHYRRSRVLALNIGSLGQWQDKLINAAVASDAA
ncbi:MAG: acyl-CoA/acyl-ACP dehydrogenase [Pseudomonadales bacterium]|nr:acyl-CoA/acyl-ACP dehydrogenase [Pseudomonadales bacterium]